MKIPFDIKYRPQIESGEYKVETGTGFPAKVMDWEYNNKICGKSVAIKVIENDGDHSLFYTLEGNRASIFPLEEGCDLFIVTPEEELSEFEKRLQEILFEHATTNSSAKEKVHQYSSELLTIVKQQLLQSGELLTKEYHEKLMETQYNKTLDGVKKNWHNYFTPQAVTDIYNTGRSDALKELPRWKKWENGACGNGRGIPLALVVRGLNGYTLVDTLGIQGEKYIMLSDLEKLPGFNE